MIETHRLKLRPLRLEDAPWIAREIAHPEVHCWLTEPPHPYGVADAVWFLERQADNPWCLAIEAERMPCGVVSILNAGRAEPDQPPIYDLGFWLFFSAHGHGYMTEAAGAIVDRWFSTTAGDVLESGWVKGNGASENVLTKLGFARTGQVRETLVKFYNAKRPVVCASLARDTWQARTLEAGRRSG